MTRVGLQCKSKELTYDPKRYCSAGFELNDSAERCQREHVEDAVRYLKDTYKGTYKEQVYQGQMIKPAPSRSIRVTYPVPAPDEHGVSRIELTESDIEGEIIVLDNRLKDNEPNRAPAGVIVLSSPNPIVNASFKVEGDLADLMLINDSEIDCQLCHFINAPRVVLATGEVTSIDSHVVTQIRDGEITVSGSLLAPNTAWLELLTPTFNMAPNSRISTNFRGYQSGEAIVRHPSGKMKFGSGQTRLLLGHFDHYYNSGNLKVQNHDQYRESLRISSGAEIESGSVLIDSVDEQANANVFGLISAQSDASSVLHYQKQFVVGDKSVKLLVRGDLNLGGAIEAGEDVNVTVSRFFNIGVFHQDSSVFESEVKRHLPYQPNVLGQDINIYTGQDLTNQGNVSAVNIAIQADNVYNEGRIKAKKILSIVGENSVSRIENRFGGVISGENVGLKSGFLVRNGSKFDFRDEEVHQMEGLSRSRRSTSGVIDVGTYFRYQKGAYKQEVKRSTAQIYAHDLTIAAPQVENVNPYQLEFFQRTSVENRIFYNDDFDNTSIVVSGNAQIDAESAFINGSAALQVGQNLILNTQSLFNERYRLRIETECGYQDITTGAYELLEVTAHKECTNIVERYLTKQNFETAQGFIAQSSDMKKIDSPTGRIFVGNNFNLETDVLENQMSFLEVHNDFDLKANEVEISTYTLARLNQSLNVSKLLRKGNKTFKECSESFETVNRTATEKYCVRRGQPWRRHDPLFSALVVGGHLNADGDKTHDFSVHILNDTDAYGRPHEYKNLYDKKAGQVARDQTDL